MELLKLNPNTYIPSDIVNDYESLIWTERYVPSGEFQLITRDITNVKAMLPEDSLVTLRDTKQVMIVENLLIETLDDDSQQLKVTGKTYESFLNQRDLAVFDDGNELYAQMYSVVDLIGLLLYSDIVESNLTTGNPYHDPYSVLPNLMVTDSTTITTALGDYPQDKWGERLPRIVEYLAQRNLGLRTIRPFSTIVQELTYDSVGYLTRKFRFGVDEMRLDIYNGVDRRSSQTVNPKVEFYDSLGALEKQSYLFTKQLFKNVVNVRTKVGIQTYYGNGATATTSGLSRRILTLDLMDIELVENPSAKQIDDYLTKIRIKAIAELRKYNRRYFFDALVSKDINYKYGVDYGLGDYVTLVGDYGFKQDLMVAEYTRIDDAEGEREYPTFTAIPS